MTNQEAIEVMKAYKDAVKIEAFDVAIKALEILEEFEKAQIITGGRLNGRTYAYKCGLEDGKRKALSQEPSGEWISELVDGEDWKGCKRQYYQPISCSKCHSPSFYKSAYCPNCGARMQEVEE